MAADYNKDGIKPHELDRLRVHISRYIDSELYAHTLAVEDEILRLAGIFGIQGGRLENLRLGALLHDITKPLSESCQLELCVYYNIPLSKDDRAVPKILHSKTGAYVARGRFGADDSVFEAIHMHTTGADDMPLSVALLKLADRIEPTRKDEVSIELRRFFYSEMENAVSPGQISAALHKTILRAFDIEIVGLEKSGKIIHPDTIAARDKLVIRD